MATYGAISFEEANTRRIARSVSSTDPNVRLRASGGEVIEAAQTPRTARVDAYCTTEQLEALRLALIAGELATLTLDDEVLDSAFLSEITDPTDIFERGTWRVSLTFEVATRVDTVHLLVWVGGDLLPDVIAITTDVGRDTKYAKATITCGTRHSTEYGQPVVLQGGVGDAIGYLFQGIVEDAPEQFYPGEWTLTCTGRLKWATRGIDSDVDYTGDTSAEAIDDLLSRRNVTNRDIPASTWTLGTKAKVKVRKGETPMSWITRADEIERMVTYEDHEGQTKRRRDDPFETAAPVETLTVGENVISIQHSRLADAIYNGVQITGLAHNGGEASYSASRSSAELDALQGGSGATNTLPLTSGLIETDADAATFGAQILDDLAPLQHRVVLTVPLNPAIVPDLPIMVHAAPLGFTGLQCLVRNVKHQIDGIGGTTTIEPNTGNFNAL